MEIAVGSRGQALVLHAREPQPVRVGLTEPGLPGDLEELVECTVYELRGEALRSRHPPNGAGWAAVCRQ